MVYLFMEGIYSKKTLWKTKTLIFFNIYAFKKQLGPQGVNSLLDLPVIRKVVLRKFPIRHSFALPSLLCSLPSFSDYSSKNNTQLPEVNV